MEPKQLPPYPLRMPPALRARLEAEAEDAGRSLNAHLLLALQEREQLQEQLRLAQYKIERLAHFSSGADVKLSPAIKSLVRRTAEEGDLAMGDALATLVLAGAAKGSPAVVYFAAEPSQTAGDYMDLFKAVSGHIAPDTTIVIEHSGTRVHVRPGDELPSATEVPSA